jgi:hypothetical protein
MMKSLIAAACLTAIASAPAIAQEPQAPTAPVAAATGAPATDTPILSGAQASADCGGLNNLAGRAFCITAPLGQIGALADAYIADFGTRGWLPAGGDDNRVVFVKRREAGGCDGLQMVAFYDTSKPAIAEAPAYLGFATIPGDVCAGQTPAASPAQ